MWTYNCVLKVLKSDLYNLQMYKKNFQNISYTWPVY